MYRSFKTLAKSDLLALVLYNLKCKGKESKRDSKYKV